MLRRRVVIGVWSFARPAVAMRHRFDRVSTGNIVPVSCEAPSAVDELTSAIATIDHDPSNPSVWSAAFDSLSAMREELERKPPTADILHAYCLIADKLWNHSVPAPDLHPFRAIPAALGYRTADLHQPLQFHFVMLRAATVTGIGVPQLVRSVAWYLRLTRAAETGKLLAVRGQHGDGFVYALLKNRWQRFAADGVSIVPADTPFYEELRNEVTEAAVRDAALVVCALHPVAAQSPGIAAYVGPCSDGSWREKLCEAVADNLQEVVRNTLMDVGRRMYSKATPSVLAANEICLHLLEVADGVRLPSAPRQMCKFVFRLTRTFLDEGGDFADVLCDATQRRLGGLAQIVCDCINGAVDRGDMTDLRDWCGAFLLSNFADVSTVTREPTRTALDTLRNRLLQIVATLRADTERAPIHTLVSVMRRMDRRAHRGRRGEATQLFLRIVVAEACSHARQLDDPSLATTCCACARSSPDSPLLLKLMEDVFAPRMLEALRKRTPAAFVAYLAPRDGLGMTPAANYCVAQLLRAIGHIAPALKATRGPRENLHQAVEALVQAAVALITPETSKADVAFLADVCSNLKASLAFPSTIFTPLEQTFGAVDAETLSPAALHALISVISAASPRKKAEVSESLANALRQRLRSGAQAVDATQLSGVVRCMVSAGCAADFEGFALVLEHLQLLHARDGLSYSGMERCWRQFGHCTEDRMPRALQQWLLTALCDGLGHVSVRERRRTGAVGYEVILSTQDAQAKVPERAASPESCVDRVQSLARAATRLPATSTRASPATIAGVIVAVFRAVGWANVHFAPSSHEAIDLARLAGNAVVACMRATPAATCAMFATPNLKDVVTTHNAVALVPFADDVVSMRAVLTGPCRELVNAITHRHRQGRLHDPMGQLGRTVDVLAVLADYVAHAALVQVLDLCFEDIAQVLNSTAPSAEALLDVLRVLCISDRLASGKGATAVGVEAQIDSVVRRHERGLLMLPNRKKLFDIDVAAIGVGKEKAHRPQKLKPDAPVSDMGVPVLNHVAEVLQDAPTREIDAKLLSLCGLTLALAPTHFSTAASSTGGREYFTAVCLSFFVCRNSATGQHSVSIEWLAEAHDAIGKLLRAWAAVARTPEAQNVRPLVHRFRTSLRLRLEEMAARELSA